MTAGRRSAVAVVGIGAMGSRIAARLLEEGHNVVVWNRTASRVDPLIALGAIPCESPAAAAAEASTIVTMTSDPEALIGITEAADGIIGALLPGDLLIQMATVGPSAVARLAASVPADVEVLDAPVLGSIGEAETGGLRIFVGGSPAGLRRAGPILGALGTPLHVGDLGAGSAAKLVANSTLFGVIGVLGEALSLADALGLPRDVCFDVLAATPLAEQAQRRRPVVDTGVFPPRFDLSLARKDADLVLAAASSLDLELRLAAAAQWWLIEAERRGFGGQDYTAVLAAILGDEPQIGGRTG